MVNPLFNPSIKSTTQRLNKKGEHMNQDVSENNQERTPVAVIAVPTPVAGCASVASQSVSENNRIRLQSLYVKGGYSSVKFWVSPNSLASVDECVAEVADTLESFQKDKAEGKLKPVSEEAVY